MFLIKNSIGEAYNLNRFDSVRVLESRSQPSMEKDENGQPKKLYAVVLERPGVRREVEHGTDYDELVGLVHGWVVLSGRG